jgi:hypothetical protein
MGPQTKLTRNIHAADKSLGKDGEQSLRLEVEAGQGMAEESNRGAGRTTKP